MTTDWTTRLAAARAEKAARVGALSDGDREEIALRAEEATILAEARAAAKEQRELDLARRFDVQRELLGPAAHIATVTIEGRDDTFIIKADPTAHAKWESGIQEIAQGNKKLNKGEVQRAYAVAAVIDWNGVTDFGPTSLNGSVLIEYLKKNSGMASPLVNAAAKLAGFIAEERKS